MNIIRKLKLNLLGYYEFSDLDKKLLEIINKYFLNLSQENIPSRCIIQFNKFISVNETYGFERCKFTYNTYLKELFIDYHDYIDIQDLLTYESYDNMKTDFFIKDVLYHYYKIEILYVRWR